MPATFDGNEICNCKWAQGSGDGGRRRWTVVDISQSSLSHSETKNLSPISPLFPFLFFQSNLDAAKKSPETSSGSADTSSATNNGEQQQSTVADPESGPPPAHPAQSLLPSLAQSGPSGALTPSGPATGVPRNVSIEKMAQGWVVSWLPPLDPETPVATYSVQYKEGAGEWTMLDAISKDTAYLSKSTDLLKFSLKMS